MRIGLLLVVVAACYAPQIPPGVACQNDSECPVGEACVAGECQHGGGTGVDAAMRMPDAAGRGDAGGSGGDAGGGTLDRDGDGVPDTADNCPNVANADQANEDGDALGDACDPCPATPGDATDTDGDGVGDACDPHPTTAGDALVVFEGFHHGVPAGWQLVGGATQVGDDLELDAGSDVAALAPPQGAPANGVVRAHIVVLTAQGTQDAGAGVAFGFDVTNGPAITCELYAPVATKTASHDTSLYDYPANKELVTGNLLWQAGAGYTVELARHGSTYTCTATPDGGAPVTTTASTSSTTNGKLAIEQFATTIRVSWLMAISSP